MALQQSPACQKDEKSTEQLKRKEEGNDTATNILSASFCAHARFPLNNARWATKAAKMISCARQEPIADQRLSIGGVIYR